MTETTQPTQAEADAKAMADAKRGYQGRARASAVSAPAPAAPAPADPPASDAALAEPPVSASPAPAEEPTQTDAPAQPAKSSPEVTELKSTLEDLKAQVKLLAGNGADAKTVREMHGQIGDINRSLKELAAASKKDAPAAEDKLATAIKKLEASADEYPELGKPFLEAIRELQSRVTPAPAPEVQAPPAEAAAPAAPAIDLQAERLAAAQEAAIAALNKRHPDRLQLKETPEFKAFIAKWKTPADRERVRTSWDPLEVAEPFDDFKAMRAAQEVERKRKQDRLEEAAQPRGTNGTPSATQPTDTDLARKGYARYARHL